MPARFFAHTEIDCAADFCALPHFPLFLKKNPPRKKEKKQIRAYLIKCQILHRKMQNSKSYQKEENQ